MNSRFSEGLSACIFLGIVKLPQWQTSTAQAAVDLAVQAAPNAPQKFMPVSKQWPQRL